MCAPSLWVLALRPVTLGGQTTYKEPGDNCRPGRSPCSSSTSSSTVASRYIPTATEPSTPTKPCQPHTVLQMVKRKAEESDSAPEVGSPLLNLWYTRHRRVADVRSQRRRPRGRRTGPPRRKLSGSRLPPRFSRTTCTAQSRPMDALRDALGLPFTLTSPRSSSVPMQRSTKRVTLEADWQNNFVKTWKK